MVSRLKPGFTAGDLKLQKVITPCQNTGTISEL